MSEPDRAVADLFKRAFNRSVPTFPRHFVATLQRDGHEELAGYIHFTAFDDGVYLCGGLCIDTRVYRRLTPLERSRVASYGSLSRWLILASTSALGAKRAVFAYTGHTRSRTDAFALGYVPAKSALSFFSRARKYLLVQWHNELDADRVQLVRRVAAHGPF